jgi:hypothetical protein
LRRLTEEELHILGVVEKHGHVCIGVPVDADWAPIASRLRHLAKRKYLVEEVTDDGPAYSLTAEACARLSP